MNNEKERKVLIFLLTTTILLSCAHHNKKKENNTINNSINSSNLNNTIYIDTLGEDILFDDDNYVIVGEDNQYTLCANTKIYTDYRRVNDILTNEISFDKSQIVTVLKVNERYANILLSDGTVGYVEKDLLIKCPNLNKYNYEIVTDYKDKFTSSLTYLYDNDGMYLGYVDVGTKCNAVATNGEYTLVTFDDGKSGFIQSSILVNSNKYINGYGIVNNNTTIFFDKELSMPDEYIYLSDIVKVLYISNNYACILINNEKETRYIDSSFLNKDYIIIDLAKQKIECYLNYQFAGSWNTRSGKDTTPTYTGLFDIDALAKDWNFTTFPGSHAKYWIPFNGGQGIHDLVGDDEANYGNELYHGNGSHGCVRVPLSASEFVYNNYNEGDMVLVRKK